MADREKSALDTPVAASKRKLFSVNDDAIGAMAEKVARFFGTGRYLMWQTVVVIVWIALNIGGYKWNWDPYPFILLNLAFSTQAAYAAPLILLAQNRQEDRDKVALSNDRRRAEQTKADTEFLARELAGVRLAVGDMASRDYVRGELEDVLGVLARIESKLDDAAAQAMERREELAEPTQHFRGEDEDQRN
ncbi:DUF1003 domain-containing protein [Corynebacterium uberis]|uniref:DUF1003 domain-containing protein n=1 Tax=Corynebacterium TaxID=1716 RepID=UPI001D0AE890|nr:MULTISPECIES: DUF1003 domain-containing protein [Corynebacterium]MCZ9308970.1 DUF1003 domain-containing protein [Corynebacterium sp. c6VSa_13]UDL74559.1 DUF1003 domain-containing protein [Corynebacterium uberis]UDL76607.1 DUF1003 domain-containing protein [Corynebacterium uberis]UDL78820.1 DUF1003 domain-containing protein [Corynebacterium uberis]UDL83237.1 DUF1003 domain-containing protein [Corynebacterium uberis]